MAGTEWWSTQALTPARRFFIFTSISWADGEWAGLRVDAPPFLGWVSLTVSPGPGSFIRTRTWRFDALSSSLKTRLKEDLIQARKGREKLRTLVLSTTLSELRNREIELGKDGDDAEVLSVIGKAVKRRKEAAGQMRAGGREELATKEEAEAEILGAYLPVGLSEAEVRGIVREIVAEGAGEMGPVMGKLMPRLKGRFDGKEANRIVREVLAE
jgi:uncharacterized protein YqeY